MIRTLAAAALAAPLLLAAPAWADTTSDLIALEHQRSAAIAAHDHAFLDAIYAGDFEGVTALGFQVDKARLMKVFGFDNPDARFSLEDLKARVFGDAAIVSGMLVTRDAKGALVARSRYMHVYVRHGGRWRIEAGEGTVIPPDQS
jgi:ketosteroid isomerase-like protein